MGQDGVAESSKTARFKRIAQLCANAALEASLLLLGAGGGALGGVAGRWLVVSLLTPPLTELGGLLGGLDMLIPCFD